VTHFRINFTYYYSKTLRRRTIVDNNRKTRCHIFGRQ